jgi:hypothetical protein
MVDDWVEEAVGMLEYRDSFSGDIDDNLYFGYEGTHLGNVFSDKIYNI